MSVVIIHSVERWLHAIAHSALGAITPAAAHHLPMRLQHQGGGRALDSCLQVGMADGPLTAARARCGLGPPLQSTALNRVYCEKKHTVLRYM